MLHTGELSCHGADDLIADKAVHRGDRGKIVLHIVLTRDADFVGFDDLALLFAPTQPDRAVAYECAVGYFLLSAEQAYTAIGLFGKAKRD